MKKIVSLLLSLLMIVVLTTATAEDVNAVIATRGSTLTMDVSITAGGYTAKIGLKTNNAPVTFAGAVGGSVNDTVPPKSMNGSFIVTNMNGVSISADGTTLSGSLDSFTVEALEAGVIGTLTFTVNEDAAFGTYTVEAYKVQGDCTVSGSITFTVTDRIPGDANADGEVTTRDALVILQTIAGYEVTINASNADCNADGEVTTRDALLILQLIAGYDVTLK